LVGAREVLKRDMVRDYIERYVRASINESSRGSRIPSETDAPQQRSAGPSGPPWASQCTTGKAGPATPATSASTAARTCPRPRRSTSTSGDALRGRRKQLLNRKIHEKIENCKTCLRANPCRAQFNLRTHATWCPSSMIHLLF